tara:strand:+ start:706 stop:1020 length:315 start_codon:yes stop_codon:yes gene_type:complete
MLFQILDGPNGNVINTIDGNEHFVSEHFSHYKQVTNTPEEIAEGVKNYARTIRNNRLAECDWIVPLTDHPKHSAFLTYRAALRGWPSDASGGFPDIDKIPNEPE